MRVSVFATGIDSAAIARPADAEVRIMKPAKPQFLEADPLESLTREQPEAAPQPAPEPAPEPAAQPHSPVSLEPAPGAPAPAAPEDAPDPNQTDMFGQTEESADETVIIEAPRPAAEAPAPAPSAPKLRPPIASNDARRRSLALKVIPRDDDAVNGAAAKEDQGAGAHRKDAVLGFFRSLKKGAGAEANDRGEIGDHADPPAAAPAPARPAQRSEPHRRPTGPASVPTGDGEPAAAPDRRDARPLAQDPPAKTAAATAEQDDEDLLEIPAFLRRQAN